MRVLITRAGGNLGRVLAHALAEAGHQPLLLDNRPVNTGYEFVEGDVCDRQQLEMWGFTYWPTARERQRLGYESKHDFAEFDEALRRGDEEYYPFANAPWWGV